MQIDQNPDAVIVQPGTEILDSLPGIYVDASNVAAKGSLFAIAPSDNPVSDRKTNRGAAATHKKFEFSVRKSGCPMLLPLCAGCFLAILVDMPAFPISDCPSCLFSGWTHANTVSSSAVPSDPSSNMQPCR